MIELRSMVFSLWSGSQLLGPSTVKVSPYKYSVNRWFSTACRFGWRAESALLVIDG